MMAAFGAKASRRSERLGLGATGVREVTSSGT